MRCKGWPIVLAALVVGVFSLAAAEAPPPPKYPSLAIGGFADFDFYASDESHAGSSSGFREGQFVLHFVSALSQKISFFAEVSLTGTSSEFKTELERGLIKFDPNDSFKISLGRFHTPINWWNTAFHHGQWLQTTVARPEMTRFGGQFLPVHFVGAIVEGAIPSGSANLYYEAGLGNGRGENVARGGDAGDVNNHRAWLARISSRPDGLYALRFGAAIYRDRISATRLAEDFDETIGAVFAAWERENPELIGEYARVRRRGLTSGESFVGDAFYVQIAYRLPVWGDRLKPYARYEKIDVADGDPVFDAQTDREGVLAGLRVEVAAFAAAKVEFRHQRSNADPYVNAAHAQVAFSF